MATKKTTRKAASGRGSPEAVEKRRAARQLNSLLLGTSKSVVELDGRTATVVAANSDVGALYGGFHLLRLLQALQGNYYRLTAEL